MVSAIIFSAYCNFLFPALSLNIFIPSLIGTSTLSTNKIIHISSRLSDIDKFYTCAHELGHAIFHYKSNVLFLEKNTLLSPNKYEIEADTFATELLIDDSLLNGYEDFFSSSCS